MTTTSLDMVTIGWELPGWEETFYPEDLPVDWRLTYFANEFPSVLVPGERWARAGATELTAWAEDVHQGFRFYLADPGPAISKEALNHARRALGDKLAGLVRAAGAHRVPARAVTRFQLLAEPEAEWARDWLPALKAPSRLIRDLRAARAWLDAFAARVPDEGGLVVLAGEGLDIDDLRRWWDLARLMGVAA